MGKPITALIEHELSEADAIRRIKDGINQYRGTLEAVATVRREAWSGNVLEFELLVLGKLCEGQIQVEERIVRLELILPGVLGFVATKILSSIKKKGQLLLGNGSHAS